MPPKPDTAAPLVSLVVMAYKQADVISQTIEGAFAQSYPNLEIVLSDDGSPDDTFVVMQKMAEAYDGPHRLRLNRNDPNMGFVDHLNHVFSLCSGELIVYNAGDDISLPHRVRKLVDVAESSEALLIHSDAHEIDQNGQRTGVVNTRHGVFDAMDLDTAATAMALCTGATCAWRPEVMTRFGPIVETPTFDDLIFGFRAKLSGGVASVPEPLLEYRVGQGLSTFESIRNLPVDAKAERAAALLKRLDLRAATLRQRARDCQTVGATRVEAIVAKELASTDYTIRLLQEPGFDRWSRFRSLTALRESVRVRVRLRKKLNVQA